MQHQSKRMTRRKARPPAKRQSHRRRRSSRNEGPLASNTLNELTGKEWIKFTKSWFVCNPAPRNEEEVQHPAKFPEEMVTDFIEFFTKRGQMVLDPFVGTGSTLVACADT